MTEERNHSLPGLDADVYFGDAETALPDWRKSLPDEADDDKLSPEEREAVIGMIGFDPTPKTQLPPSRLQKSLGYQTKDRGQPCKPGESAERSGCIPAKEPAGSNGNGHAPQQSTQQPQQTQQTTASKIVQLPKAIKQRINKAVSYVPEKIRAPFSNAFHIVEGVMLAGNKATKALALETAKNLGMNEQQTEKLGRALGAVDFWAQVAVGNSLLVAGQVIPAKVASVVPFASAGYLLYAAARHPVKSPWAMLKGASTLAVREFPQQAKKGASFLWRAVRNPLQSAHAHKLLELWRRKAMGGDIATRIGRALMQKNADWWEALFAVCLDEVHDAGQAADMADRLLAKKPAPFTGQATKPSPFTKGYTIKAQGQPCKQGETAERSGCIPASGESGSKPQEQGKPAKLDDPDFAYFTSSSLFSSDETSKKDNIRQRCPEPCGKEAVFDIAKPKFEEFQVRMNKGKGLDKILGAGVHFPTSPEGYVQMIEQSMAEPGPAIFIAPMKGARADKKVQAKYGGDWARLTDIVRGTVAVDKKADIPKAVKGLREAFGKAGWKLYDATNKMENPVDSGYRDLNLLWQSPDGFLVEVQVNTKPMLYAKEKWGHVLYEEWRHLVEKGNLTEEEQAEVKNIEGKSSKIYEDAWAKS